ncbi:hypothetical protein pb186bvf_014394 [Paramecium bursaria]
MELDLMIEEEELQIPIQENDFYDDYEISTRSHQLYMNRGSRREQLDRFQIIGSVYGIYDGHGSSHCSEYLSKNLIDRIRDYSDTQNYERVFQQIDKELSQYNDSGSVALVVSIQNSAVTIASLGDSKAIVTRENSFTQLSVTHVPSIQSEKLRIEQQGGWVLTKGNVPRVQGRLTVTRAFGDYDLKQYVVSTPDITRYNIQDGDQFIIMGSDGLWNELSEQEIVQYLQKNKNSKNLAKGLYELIKTKTDYIRDNITIIVIPL